MLGYAFATKGSPALASSNVFERIQQKVVKNRDGSQFTIGISDGIYVADATLSGRNERSGNGGNFSKVDGGWAGHSSPHLAASSARRGQSSGQLPAGAMHSIWINMCNGTRFQKCISGAQRVLIFGGKQMPGRGVLPSSQRPFFHGLILPPFFLLDPPSFH